MLLRTVSMHKGEMRNLLRKVQKPSFWRDGIRLQLRKGSKADFDSLVEQLRDQAKDCPSGMREILGDEVYDKIIRK